MELHISASLNTALPEDVRVLQALAGAVSTRETAPTAPIGTIAEQTGIVEGQPDAATLGQMPAATPTPVRNVLNTDTVREALRSDPRYTKRTLAAIQQYLNGCEADDVSDLVDRMEDDGYLRVTHRRRDGVALYAIA
jgi:hypothetical protein